MPTIKQMYTNTPNHGEKLITLEVLESLFIQCQDYIIQQLRKYPSWKMGLYSDTKWFLCSCVSGEDSVVTIELTTNTIEGWAEQMFDALWAKNFPLHVKARELQQSAQRCAAFLNLFLSDRQLKIHDSPNECYGCGLKENTPHYIPGYCDYCGGLFSRSNKNIQNLLYDFFEINRKDIELERLQILRGLKG
jgi:hypothetical protein